MVEKLPHTETCDDYRNKNKLYRNWPYITFEIDRPKKAYQEEIANLRKKLFAPNLPQVPQNRATIGFPQFVITIETSLR